MPSIDPQSSDSPTGKTYWRSLEDLADTPEYREMVAREFPSLMPELLSESSRRGFLKFMGASFALAGLTSCRWPKEKILPYANRPDGRSPGTPVDYATVYDLGGSANALLVKSYDGRPIKVEGNPQHPGSQGKSDGFAQASLLDLYDPDRAKYVTQRESAGSARKSWDDFQVAIRKQLDAAKSDGGASVRVLCEASSSDSLRQMRARFQEVFPKAAWLEYEPLSRDNERLGTELAFGKSLRPHFDFEKAQTVVCFDADSFDSHPNALSHVRGFSKARRKLDGKHMNRLWAIESRYSVTGGMADNRFPVASADIPAAIGALAHELLVKGGLGQASPQRDDALKACASRAGEFPWIAAVAKDLAAHAEAAFVTVGPQQSPECHALAHLINAALKATGKCVTYTEETASGASHIASLKSLCADMNAGKVQTLVILGGNPVYDAPSDLGFKDALSKVASTSHLSLFANETSSACQWRLPRAHYLETWGDARSFDGTYSIGQPLIEAFYGGRSSIELLALLLNENPRKGHDIVRRTFERLFPDEGDRGWRRALHDGFVKGSTAAAVAADPVAPSWLANFKPAASASGIEVSFYGDMKVHDGRFANNGWLQELPDPLTKVTWDNPALMSVETANELGVVMGDMVEITVGNQKLEVPVYPMPGQAKGTLSIALGYGRGADAGRVGDGVGFDTYSLRSSESPWFVSGATVRVTGNQYTLASTQDHHAIDKAGEKERDRRVEQLIRETDHEEYHHHPDFAKHLVHHPPLHQLWESPTDYSDGHKWGMTIDLNVCNGCSACVVACQAENNIPVVGKDEVRRGREMQWMRIDRYFKGEPESPAISNQPINCQQCENAPCESVCPVAATVHSSEGLNDMVYNRCVGTRYCLNNCPYKVRRFNWFLNTGGLTEVEKMKFNPEVSVRSRGVMEKCTFCIQRIKKVTIKARGEKRPVRDGEITPACAQSCPADAIVFGDLNDENSRVAKEQNDPRSYALLSELNTRPRNLFMAKINNPAPDVS